MFRFKSGVKVDYNRQGYIYFTSRLYKDLPEEDQRVILNLCLEHGGESYQALFEFVTTDATATAVCMKHCLSKSQKAIIRATKSGTAGVQPCFLCKVPKKLTLRDVTFPVSWHRDGACIRYCSKTLREGAAH